MIRQHQLWYRIYSMRYCLKKLLQIWSWVLPGCIFLLVPHVFAATHNNHNNDPACTIVINEFSSAGQRYLQDEDGDWSDWIELYNCTAEDINLNGWFLSDRELDLRQWQFPDIHIPAKGFLTVYASKKDRHQAPLHTNFSIAASGEELFLSDPAAKLVDHVPAMTLQKGEVAGRYPDGGADFFILSAPSPDTNNLTPAINAIIAPPLFSLESGFYKKPFDLKLSHFDENITIYYTLDGSEPDPDNLNGTSYRYKNNYQQLAAIATDKSKVSSTFLFNEYITYKYQQPIRIKDRTLEPDRVSQISTTYHELPQYIPPAKIIPDDTLKNKFKIVLNRGIDTFNSLRNKASRKWHKIKTGGVKEFEQKEYIKPIVYDGIKKYSNKGTPVRAIAVLEQNGRRVTSPIATNSYFIGDQNQFSLPIIALTIPEKHLFDYVEGSLVAGIDYDTWLSELIDEQPIMRDRPANYKRVGKDQKMSGAITFINNDKTVTLDADYKVHGGATRRLPNK